MTAAKQHHKDARALLLKHLDMHPGKVVGNDLDPAEVGIVEGLGIALTRGNVTQ